MADNRKTDEALLLAFKDGDYAAFELLYGRYRKTVYRMVLRQCGHGGIAEELAQEIWMKIIAASDSYVVTARFTTWLYRIVQNRIIDHVRSAAHRHEQGFDSEEDAAGSLDIAGSANDQPDVHALRVENTTQLIDAIEALPGPQREAVLLHFEAELGLEEIARITDTTRETVKSRLRYGVRKIREALAAQGLLPAPGNA